MANRRTRILGIMLGTFIGGTLLSANIAFGQEYQIAEGSTITYHVSHPMHDVTAVGNDIKLLKNPTYNAEQPKDFSGVQAIPIQAPWKSFDSGNANRDANTRLVVKESQFPMITYVVEQVADPKPAGEGVIKATANGRMYIAGQKQPTTAALELHVDNPEQLTVNVKTTINMTDFGIEPPKLLLIAADEMVRIEADLKLVPLAATAPTE